MDDMLSLTAATLTHLIKVCKDGEQGFQTAANQVTDAQLKTTLLAKATHFQDFIHDLQDYSLSLKETPTDRGSLTGALYRGWMNLKSTLTDDQNQAMLVECERGITMALTVYQDVLAEPGTVDSCHLLQRQYDVILADHAHICDLLNHYKTN